MSFDLKRRKTAVSRRLMKKNRIFETLGLTEIGRIGKGAFGSIYKVENSQGEKFALKISRYEWQGSKSVVDNEVNALESLKGKPFILPLCGHKELEDDGLNLKILALPLADDNLVDTSYDLFKNGTSEKRIDLATKLRFMVEMATALKEVHAAGLIHRDINMGNVLIFKNHAFLADFGLATKVGEAKGKNRFSITPGSLPEDSFKNKEIDPTQKTDVFSLGVIFAMMLDSEYQDCLYSVECKVGDKSFLNDLKTSSVSFKAIKNFREEIQKQRKKYIEELKEEIEETQDEVEKKEYEEILKKTKKLHEYYKKDKKIANFVYNKMLSKEEERLTSKELVKSLKKLYKKYLSYQFKPSNYSPKCPKHSFN